MKSLGQLFVGLLTALASSLIVLSAASLSLLEGGLNVLPTATSSPANTPAPGETITLAPTEESQVQPGEEATQVSTTCPIPPGWIAYRVQIGDTLETVAEKAGISPEEVYRQNCLPSEQLMPNSVLYLPIPEPTATLPRPPTVVPTVTFTFTATFIPCGPPPATWVRYTVQPGDTLYRLSLAFGVSVAELKAANCLSSDRINAYQLIYVPNRPTRVPSLTLTPAVTITPTSPPTHTITPTITLTPTETLVPSVTLTPTETLTPTVTDTLTATPTSTDTATPTPTPTSTSTSTPTLSVNLPNP